MTVQQYIAGQGIRQQKCIIAQCLLIYHVNIFIQLFIRGRKQYIDYGLQFYRWLRQRRNFL